LIINLIIILKCCKEFIEEYIFPEYVFLSIHSVFLYFNSHLFAPVLSIEAANHLFNLPARKHEKLIVSQLVTSSS